MKRRHSFGAHEYGIRPLPFQGELRDLYYSVEQLLTRVNPDSELACRLEHVHQLLAPTFNDVEFRSLIALHPGLVD